MKLTRTHANKHLAPLPICVILLLGSLSFPTNAVAASPVSGPVLSPELQGPTPLVIEGKVEQIISEMQPRGLIISRAIVTVEKVVQGTLQDSQVTIRYKGGTVGELTMRASDEPYLVEGMRLRAKLTPNEGGDYRIANPDTDLTILEGGIGVVWVPTGQKWPDTSIPVPIRINNNCADIPDSGEVTAVQNAMATWTNASCSYFAYSYQAGACTTDTFDGTNCVSWSPASCGGTLGWSYWYFNGSNEIFETDVTLCDGDVAWSTSPGAGQFDVESSALHELGHSLGLDHNSSDPAIVMYPSITSGQLRRNLHTDDRNGVCALYTDPLPAAPSGLTATPVPPTQINLSWTDNSSNEDGFRIERSSDGGATWPWSTTVGANVTTYPNSGLVCNQTYHYRVLAYNTSGNSGYSNTAYAIPASDIYEPNNIANDAKLIGMNGAAQGHNFHAGGDMDWVKFTVLANVPYTITTSNLGLNTDTFLELYDMDATTVLTSNDDCNPPAWNSCINNWSDPDSGTYFVRVRQIGGAGDCTKYEYDLAVVADVETIFLPIILKNSP